MSDVRTLILPTDEATPDVVLQSLFSEVRGTIPDMVRADGEKFAIILADPTDASGREYNARAIPDGTAAVLAIGLPDQTPTAGTFTLTYGADTTAALANGISAAALQTALNALASMTAAQVTVTASGSDYLISFAAPGVRDLITGDGSFLVPLSAATVRRYREGNGDGQREVQILSLTQAPYATATDFDPLPVAAYTLDSIQTGTSDLPSIQLLTLDPPPYGGTFTVDGHIIPWNASEQTFADTYGNDVSVEKIDDFSWQFTQATNGALTSDVDLARLLVPTGFLVTVNLSTYEFLFAFSQLAAGTDRLSPKLSFRVTFPDELPKTFLLADVDVLRSVINSDNLVSAAVTGYPAADSIVTKDEDGNVALDGNLSANVGTFQGVASSDLTLPPVGVSYSTSIGLSFGNGYQRQVTLTGNTTLTMTGQQAGSRMEIELTASGGSRTVTYPSGGSTWTVLGSALPTTIPSGKSLLLRLYAVGSGAGDIRAEGLLSI